MTSPSLAPAHPPDGAAPAPALPVPLLGGYLGGLVVAELLLTVDVPSGAAAFGALALAACLGPLLPLDRPGAMLLPVLAALPAVRLSMMAIPAADLSPVGRSAALAVPALVAVGVVAGVRPRCWRLLRRGPGGWRQQAAVALVALPLAPFAAWLAPPLPAGGLAAVAVLALTVVPEELLYRGLLVPALAGVVGKRAVPIAAAVYAATFLGYGSPPSVACAFAVGLLLGWLRQHTGSAAGVVGARVLLVLLTGWLLAA
ncbi:CPBP family intramembrane glutamic endopeptidase [Phytohabitans sp. LJ34]|uniref:CPBP family intramembrane glutamic endopeptidase n=1 Tax=Phytohabitans sp. LJ34 TaxID=3452217 RepID=UPI003F88900F